MPVTASLLEYPKNRLSQIHHARGSNARRMIAKIKRDTRASARHMFTRDRSKVSNGSG
jgi:hypothetical protein